jgi:dTDP-4-dehydrorhamnose 3,5-epimerase-like enzyme
MAEILHLPRFVEEKGCLTVMDNLPKLLPFSIKRLFFINTVTNVPRGGHRHFKTRQAVICIQGRCVVSNNDGRKQQRFLLDDPTKCLILEARDWHIMHSFAPGTILLVFASEVFDPNDYIREPYKELVNGTV